MAGIIAKGDFVKIEFTGKRGSDGRVFDTTSAEEAKKALIFNNEASYTPVLVVTGKGMTVAGLDEALEGMAVGAEKTVTLAPEKAYGIKRQDLIHVLPIAEFRKRNVEPVPGMPVEIDSKPARVRSVNSGRVTVDMNHPLAGETITFRVKVVDKIEGLEAKANALLERNNLKNVAAKVVAGKLEIAVPESANTKDAQFFVSKASFVGESKRLIPEAKEVVFVETYSLQEEKK